MLVCVGVEAEVVVRFTVTGSSSKRTMVGDVCGCMRVSCLRQLVDWLIDD